MIGSLIQRLARRLADPRLPNDPNRRVFLVLDEFHILQPIPGLHSALATGREKGLVAMVELQFYGQLIEKYGDNGGKLLAEAFQFKIYGRVSPGQSEEEIVKNLGTREVSALLPNRTRGKDDLREVVEERSTIPTLSAKQLASTTGILRNRAETGDVRAVVHYGGDCYILDWPFTLWRKRREGFLPAPWLSKPPRAQPAKPKPAKS